MTALGALNTRENRLNFINQRVAFDFEVTSRQAKHKTKANA